MVHTQKKRKATAKADSNDIQTAIEDFGQRCHCDVCAKDITHLIIFKCAECPDFDLCLPCFSAGAEQKDHKKDHPYRVIDVLDFPIFEDGWGADEELLLVEGLEMFGIGNWEHIAEHIGTKNKLQCEEHYEKIYINSDNWPYPDMADKVELEQNGVRKHARAVPVLPKFPRPPASQPANHEIAGYMPGRREFDTVYENDAEQIVKDLDFNDDDSTEDTELKLAVMRIYNAILDERLRRKDFIFERDFVDFRRIQAIEKKRTKEEKELYQIYRVFARMQTQNDFDGLMDGLVQEQKLVSRINQLQDYLRMGVKTAKDSLIYEKEKAARAAGKSANLVSNSHMGPERSALRRVSANMDVFGVPLKSADTLTATSRRMLSQPLDISSANGFDLLSDAEQQLCSSLHIYPMAYIAIKEQLITENISKGFVKRRQLRNLLKIETTKSMKIYDFMIKNGWIFNKLTS